MNIPFIAGTIAIGGILVYIVTMVTYKFGFNTYYRGLGDRTLWEAYKLSKKTNRIGLIKMVKWLKTERKKGKDLNESKELLIEQGWNKSLVKKALKLSRGKNGKKNKLKKELRSKRGEDTTNRRRAKNGSTTSRRNSISTLKRNLQIQTTSNRRRKNTTAKRTIKQVKYDW